MARSIQTLIKLSKQPYRKTIDTFDFTAQPSVDERRIRELLTLSFIDRKENILFLGPPGIGKTHLAISIGMEAIARRYETYFITAHDLVTQLRAYQEGKLEKKLRVFVKPAVLIIDEMGYLKLDPNSARYLFQVIAHRYEHAPIIFTSNKSFGEWGEVVGDSVLATAMFDHRLLHHSIIFNLKGENYRLREKRLQEEKQKDPRGPSGEF